MTLKLTVFLHYNYLRFIDFVEVKFHFQNIEVCGFNVNCNYYELRK